MSTDPDEPDDSTPDPDCPSCLGTGFTDQDTGLSVDVNECYRRGAYVNAVECSCMSDKDDD